MRATLDLKSLAAKVLERNARARHACNTGEKACCTGVGQKAGAATLFATLRTAPAEGPKTAPLPSGERPKNQPATATRPGRIPPRLPKSDACRCQYDWAPVFRGVRLRCVTHHGGHGPGSTVIRIFYDGHDTLLDMLENDFLTGLALADAERPQ
jgi:hypothetical protein